MSLRIAFSLFLLLGVVAYAAYRIWRPLYGESGRSLRHVPRPDDLGEPKSEQETEPRKSWQGELREMVSNIPPGKVVSFAELGSRVEESVAPSSISRFVRSFSEGSDLPWWRVVRKEGGRGLVSQTIKGREQRTLLEKEGVEFQEGSIVLARYEWNLEKIGKSSRSLWARLRFTTAKPLK